MKDQQDYRSAAVQEMFFDEKIKTASPAPIVDDQWLDRKLSFSRNSLFFFNSSLVFFSTYPILPFCRRKRSLDCLAGQYNRICPSLSFHEVKKVKKRVKMNKLKPTTERVFMSLVGPGGSGKGTFLHKLVTTFSTAVPFHTVFFINATNPRTTTWIMLWSKIMNLYKASLLNKCCSLPRHIKKGVCYFLTIFWRIVEITRFCKGNYRCMLFILNTTFCTSSIGRDVELQLTHIVLFQSPRDINQLTHLDHKWKEKNLCHCGTKMPRLNHLVI